MAFFAVSRVQRVADIIAEITAAAAAQSDGIAHVNGAVAQLDQATQQNAALVEQSSAAAESLRDQAQRLIQVVGVFQTGQSGGSSGVQTAGYSGNGQGGARMPSPSKGGTSPPSGRSSQLPPPRAHAQARAPRLQG